MLRISSSDADTPNPNVSASKMQFVAAPRSTKWLDHYARKKLIPFTFLAVLVSTLFMFVQWCITTEETLESYRVKDNPNYDLPVVGTEKISGVNPGISSLFKYDEVWRYIKKRKQNGTLQEEPQHLKAFMDKVLATEKPLFDTVPGTSAIVTTCNLDTMCVTNLVYMMEFIHPDIPIELWLERKKAPEGVKNYILRNYYPRIRVRYLDDIQNKYFGYFGKVVRGKGIPPFHFKLMTIIGSEFEKIFWVDSDAFLLQNVTRLMKQSKTGTLYWHDIWRIHENNPVWEMMNITKPEQGFSQESGILYLDKTIAWRELYLAAYMNQKQPLYYSLFWGDKETFFLSSILLNRSYTFVPHAPFMLGKYGYEIDLELLLPVFRPNDFFGYSFVQLDIEGRPLCVHLVSGKSFVLKYMKQNVPLFSVLRPYDPNGSHMDRNGLKNKTFDVVLDSAVEPMPLLKSNYVLGPFENRFVVCYKEAQRIRQKCLG